MNRLMFWMKSKTQYNIHSPFVFDLYSNVLFAKLTPAQSAQVPEVSGWGERRYYEMVYKFQDYFGLKCVEQGDEHTVLQGGSSFGKVKIVCRPHADRKSECAWNKMQTDIDYGVSIDLYDVGILLSNAKLHPQKFLLR